MKRLLHWLLVRHWQAIDEEAHAARAQPDGQPAGFNYRPLVVLVIVAVSLSLQEYYGQRGTFGQLMPRLAGDEYWSLKSFVWWSGWRFCGYVLLPVAVIALLPGERLRDYFIGLRSIGRHLKIYLLLFVLVFPFVFLASHTESFQRLYPFYKLANRSSFDLWIWEALYALQFFSLEFFFRGFMLHGLRELGSNAIFVMLVPYCMIHFGKPLPETLGAIIAGLVLGTLAMRTRSIWGGVMIHVAVAVSMDLLALSHCPPQESGLPCRDR